MSIALSASPLAASSRPLWWPSNWSDRWRCLPINFRAEDNAPRHAHPVILGEAALPQHAQRILLVDDVSVSGQTLAVAKRYLAGHDVTTLAMKGQADIVLFPEVAQCVNWPWKLGEAEPVVGEPMHDFGQ